MSVNPTVLAPENIKIAAEHLPALKQATIATILAGGALTAVGWVYFGDFQQVFFSYFWAFYFAFTITLGGLFWTMIFHLTQAGWSVVLRRHFENLARNIPIFAVFFVPVFLFLPVLYTWAAPSLMGTDERELLDRKWPYLTSWFWLVRSAFFFTVWIIYARAFTQMSLEQDSGTKPELSKKMEYLSATGILLLGITATFMAFDWVMSLDWIWFSTMFGVYTWAGCIRSSLATVTLTVILLQANGYLKGVVTEEHRHDCGKLLFGFTVFWAYTGFSQYFLIWYANLPEETRWFVRRGGEIGPDGLLQYNSWMWYTMILAAGHFGFPFLFLLARAVKRNVYTLAFICVWIITFHGIDLYYQIMPTIYNGGVLCMKDSSGVFTYYYFQGIWLHLSALAFVFGTVGFFIVRSWEQYPLIPKGDPRLEESIAFANNEA